MRLASYRLNGSTSYGVVVGGDDSHALSSTAVVDIPRNVAEAPASVIDFLEQRADFLRRIPDSPAVPLDDVELLPVIPEPRNIICIGVNYLDHATETGSQVPSYPTIFSKFTSSIAPHGGDIRIPRGCAQVDYEAELGLVIGTSASRVGKNDALAAVAGYFALNDVSARDYQVRTSQWTQGKGFPTFAPTGPYLVTPDEFGDPSDRRIRLRIGDEVLQDASTADMIFDVPTIVSYVSSVCDLRPGDIIATGTPAGVGAARDPQRFLAPGDTVSVLIEGLPTLTNKVVAHD